MNKLRWIILAVVIVLLSAGLIWYFSTDRTTTVGICYRTPTDRENAVYRQELEDALRAQGYEVLAVDCDNNQAKQLKQIETLVDRTSVALIVEPVMTSASDELLAKLQEAAVPVILTDRKPERDLSELENICYIGYDVSISGILQAQMVAELPSKGDLNGDGRTTCLFLQGPEDDLDAITYTETCQKALKLGPVEWDLLEVLYCAWSQDSGFLQGSRALSKYGKDMEVIICSDDAIALGASAAIEEGGRQVGKDVYLVSIGGSEDGLEAVSQGKISGTVAPDRSQKISLIMDALRAMMAGEDPEAYRFMDFSIVTAP